MLDTRSITVVALAFVGSGLFAQPYIPLLDTTATWQDYYMEVDLSGSEYVSYECYVYYLRGDTAVNDTAYKILRRTGLYEHHFVGSPLQMTWYADSLTVLLREDTAAKKVFVREPDWTYEVVFYDFSVGLGPYPATYRYPWVLEVIAVDSVVLSDGPHRRITLDDGWSEHTVVEGIGSLAGFIPAQEISPFLQSLICHTQGDTANYVLPLGEPSCACGSNVGIPSVSVSDLQISPSPSQDLCQLQGAPPNAPFHLRSMDGRILRSGICSSTGTATIDMSDLSAAMYVILVHDASRSFQIRVVKE